MPGFPSPTNLGSSQSLSFLITDNASSSDLSNSIWLSIAPTDPMDIPSVFADCCKTSILCVVQQSSLVGRVGWRRPQEHNYAEARAQHRKEKNDKHLPSDNPKCVRE